MTDLQMGTSTSDMFLTEDTLGSLDLGPAGAGATRSCGAHGFVVTNWDIGFPAVREVVRNRALADGTIDDTRFVGNRAITVNLMIDQRADDPQLIIDRLMPYLSPRYRPRLHWRLPHSNELRSTVVRGANAPVTIQREKFNLVAAQWVSVGGLLEDSTSSGGPNCEIINPGSDTEDGRTYDLTFDRSYPFSLGIGDRLITNRGNAVADWRATIFGATTNPSLFVNGVEIAFTRNGGLDITGGTSVTIDSRERTVLLNNDPAESRYDRVNFGEWSWEQVRLQPGDNIVRFEAETLSPQSSVQFCWRSAWL